jgi:hypothetical protein
MKRLFVPLPPPAPTRAQDRLSAMPDWFVNPDEAPPVPDEALGFREESGFRVEGNLCASGDAGRRPAAEVTAGNAR